MKTTSFKHEQWFAVSGVDTNGRKFAGIYDKETARYLSLIDARLNIAKCKCCGAVVKFIY